MTKHNIAIDYGKAFEILKEGLKESTRLKEDEIKEPDLATRHATALGTLTGYVKHVISLVEEANDDLPTELFSGHSK